MKKIFIFFLFSFTSLFAFEQITKADFEEKLANKNVIIDFYSVYWPACKVLGKNIKQYSKNKQENVFIYKVDVAKEQEIVEQFNLQGVPAIAFFKNGKLLVLEYGIKKVKEIKQYEKIYFGE